MIEMRFCPNEISNESGSFQDLFFVQARFRLSGPLFSRVMVGYYLVYTSNIHILRRVDNNKNDSISNDNKNSN